MKRVVNFLFIALILILAFTYHYRLPYTKHFMNNRGLVTVYNVSDRPELEAEIIIVTKIDERLTVEVIKGPGPENVIMLKGEAAKRYLINTDLDGG